MPAEKLKLYVRPNQDEVNAKLEAMAESSVKSKTPEKFFVDPKFSQELKTCVIENISLIGNNWEVSTELIDETPVLTISQKDSYLNKFRIYPNGFGEFTKLMKITEASHVLQQERKSALDITPIAKGNIINPIKKTPFGLIAGVTAALAGLFATVMFFKKK